MSVPDPATGSPAAEPIVVGDVSGQPGLANHPDKISAYYSLQFPNVTYYLQTVNVTIGRRPVCTGPSSSSEAPQIDVDLGPLKNVSRLHARIEYEEDQERFVLVVLGRNGAWVDNVWSGNGSRVPLGARSQIQIATRTFHFVLPPPPVPEDSPSPSSRSSTGRHLSPSIDITSLSPPSSPPSPLPVVEDELPPEKPEIPLKLPKASTKKRKKTEPEPRPPPPEVMPPRPSITYAQLCYRAIKSMEGKATLQDICRWVSENFDWYRYNEGSGWENSIRHNLSSNRAFVKMERCAGERGKGFFWGVDVQYEHIFEEQDAKSQNAPKEGKPKGKGKNPKVSEPSSKRKGDGKGGPPPPLLTSTPLPAFASKLQVASTSSAQAPPMITVKQEPIVHSAFPFDTPSTSMTTSTTTNPAQEPPKAGHASHPTTHDSSLPSIPSDMIVPIVIGHVPSSPSNPPDSKIANSNLNTSNLPALTTPPIALHKNTIFLNPTIFSSLTPEQLKELEALGARKAIDILQGYIVRFLKERIKTGSSKAKGKKRAKNPMAVKNEGDSPSEGGMKSGPIDQDAQAPVSKSRPKVDLTSGPFTTTPLPLRHTQPPPTLRFPVPAVGTSGPIQPLLAVMDQSVMESTDSMPPRSPSPPMGQLAPPPVHSSGELSSELDEPALKKRKVEAPVAD